MMTLALKLDQTYGGLTFAHRGSVVGVFVLKEGGVGVNFLLQRRVLSFWCARRCLCPSGPSGVAPRFVFLDFLWLS